VAEKACESIKAQVNLNGPARRLSRAALHLVYVRSVLGSTSVIRSDRLVLRGALLAALALALGVTLSACGRKGPLDQPPSSQLSEPSSTTEQQYDKEGRPLAPPGQKKRLPIDWLLD